MTIARGHRGRSLAIVGAALAILLVPGIALADTGGGTTIGPRVENGVTIDVEGATLNSKLMATVRFAVVCDEITYFDWDTYQEVTTTEGRLGGDATLLQAQGRSIAIALGYASPVDVTCDGSTVNHVTASVVAQNLPLKSGSALAGVSAYISGGGEGEGGYGQSGPTAIKLAR